ncbi:hypothetical protein HDK77DRAFT_85383 [Phyllosticta capitalensis]|uniref:uncharacterized protein n=1 Tax=Phyllosticta capitalensis TaxID=121624 RepID=UPI00312EE3D9
MRSDKSPFRILCSLFLSIVLFWFPLSTEGAPQAAAPAGPVEWHVGMNLRLYIAPDTAKTTTCAPDVAGADKDAGLLPIWSNDGKIVTTKPAASGPKASLSFRFVSGWLADSAKFDSNSQTFIKASEPFATGGDCWISGANDIVEQKPCGSDRLFQFYIETKATAGNMHLMRNADVKHIKVDPNGALVSVNDNVDANVCVYQALTGKLVAAPAQDFHVPADQITNLIGQKVPGSTEPTAENLLPGCDTDTNTNLDCLISRAFNSLPEICQTKPHNMQCVLHLAPAFCFDVPARRFKKDASAEVEACIRAVSLGPCVANPPGGACACGLFAGIVQFASGGGQPGKRLMARSGEYSLEKRASDPLFGEPENNLPLLDQFWVGVMKSLINGVIDLVNLLRNGLVYSARSTCYSMTFKLPGQDQKEIDKTREGCAEVFKPQKPIPTIPYNGEIEQAGGIFADVVQVIFAVNDLAQAAGAAKWVGRIEEVMSYFKPVSNGAGKILEAEGKGGRVQLFNDYGDGKPVPFYTDAAVEDLQASTKHNAFKNCGVCGGGVKKRQGGNIAKLLCCKATPSREPEIIGAARTEEQRELAVQYSRHVTIDEAIPVAERVFGNAYPASQDAEVIRVFREGAEVFRKYYIDQAPDPPAISRAMNVFYDQLKEQYQVLSKQPALEDQYRKVITDASRQMWGLDFDETVAIENWVASGLRDHVNLEAALRKMNPVKTWTITQQNAPTDVLNMLIKVEPGLDSKGPPGIYTLRDIKRSSTVADIRPTNPEPIAFSTSLGMQPIYMPGTLPVRYVVLSETGRYIASVTGTAYHEVMFYEKLCGKFQLLGYTEVNGGVQALREGRRPPFIIFYFREIEAPAFTPRPEPPNLPIIRKVPHRRLAKL